MFVPAPQLCWPIVRDALASTQSEFFGSYAPSSAYPSNQSHSSSRRAGYKGKGKGKGPHSKGKGRGQHTGAPGDDGGEEEGGEGQEEEEEEEGGDVEGMADGERRLARVEPLERRFAQCVGFFVDFCVGFCYGTMLTPSTVAPHHYIRPRLCVESGAAGPPPPVCVSPCMLHHALLSVRSMTPLHLSYVPDSCEPHI